MTKVQEQKLQCPKCGQIQKIMVYHSINASLNPELKEKLLKGQINMFHCGGCGQKVIIQLVLIYHDMEKKFCVQYCPFEKVKKNVDQLAEMYTIEGKPNYPGNFHPQQMMDYFHEPHIVLSLGEMARYVQFREVLHEKLVYGKSIH